MGNVGYAMLFRTKKHLELLVSSDKETCEQNVRAFKDNPSKRLIGYLGFRNLGEPKEIVEDLYRR